MNPSKRKKIDSSLIQYTPTTVSPPSSPQPPPPLFPRPTPPQFTCRKEQASKRQQPNSIKQDPILALFCVLLSTGFEIPYPHRSCYPAHLRVFLPFNSLTGRENKPDQDS